MRLRKRPQKTRTDQTEPVRVTFADVSAAPYRIRDGVPQTPCEVGRF